jgi:hypothetical protein
MAKNGADLFGTDINAEATGQQSYRSYNLAKRIAMRRQEQDFWAGLEAFRATLSAHQRTEQFHFLTAHFDIVRARYLLSRLPRKPIEIPALEIAQTYGLNRRNGTRIGAPDAEGWRQVHGSLIQIDENYAAGEGIDLEQPLIIATLSTRDQEAGFLVIDGWHRIRRAAIIGRASLPGYVLTEAETKLVRLD